MHERLGGLRREGGPAGMCGADGLGQFVSRHIFEQIADGSSLQCALNQNFFFELVSAST